MSDYKMVYNKLLNGVSELKYNKRKIYNEYKWSLIQCDNISKEYNLKCENLSSEIDKLTSIKKGLEKFFVFFCNLPFLISIIFIHKILSTFSFTSLLIFLISCASINMLSLVIVNKTFNPKINNLLVKKNDIETKYNNEITSANKKRDNLAFELKKINDEIFEMNDNIENLVNNHRCLTPDDTYINNKPHIKKKIINN